MSDNLRDEILLRMNKVIDSEQQNYLANTLDILFNDYTIEKKSREIALPEEHNKTILKNFLGEKILQGRSKGTIELYNTNISRLFDAIQKPITEITANDIRFFLAKYQAERGVSLCTMRNIRNAFMSFFKWCTNEEIIVRNPMIKIPTFQVPKAKIKPITEVEMEKIRAVCGTTRDRAIIEFLYSTGCRVSECSAFNINDVDFKDGKATIRKGKGNKERTVYLSDKTMVWLEKYVNERTDNDIALWVGKQGRLTKNGIEALIHRLGNRAEIGSIHPHQFRHALATDLVRRNVPMPIVQNILGHEDISTTMIYVEVQENDIQNAHKKYIA